MPARIAYIILAHRAPWQLHRLVQRLRGPGVHFVLHLDANSSGPEWDLLTNELTGPDVLWAPRVTCRWGDFSLVHATLGCLKALNNLDTDFDFVTLLSGQDYPVKPRSFFSEYLASRRGQCLMFIYPFPFPDWVNGGYHRLPTWRIPLPGKPRRILPPQLVGFRHKKLPFGYHPFGGSQWWCLPGEAVQYVHEFVEAHPVFVHYFRQAMIPDEMFFHTILGNSHFEIDPGSNNITYAKWRGGPNPIVLTAADLDEITDSDYLFARKFDINEDPELLDRIDTELIGIDPRVGSSYRGGRAASAG
jgi:hypothetical protein